MGFVWVTISCLLIEMSTAARTHTQSQASFISLISRLRVVQRVHL